jgi:hypothetical protein
VHYRCPTSVGDLLEARGPGEPSTGRGKLRELLRREGNRLRGEDAAELGDEEAASPTSSMDLDDSDGSKGNVP